MSKQSEAKERQGYEAKPVKRECKTCQHFLADRDWPTWMKEPKYKHLQTEDHKVEMNKRCNLGGFAVKLSASCDSWAWHLSA